MRASRRRGWLGRRQHVHADCPLIGEESGSASRATNRPGSLREWHGGPTSQSVIPARDTVNETAQSARTRAF